MSDENTAGGWPANEKIVQVGGKDVKVTIAPNGDTNAKICMPDTGTRFEISTTDSDQSVTAYRGHEKVYLNFEDGSIGIPYKDDGEIPPYIGHQTLPGWIMKGLRLHGFYYEKPEALWRDG